MSTTKRILGDYTIESLNGNVNIIGNLVVSGTTASVSSTDTQVIDNIITLNAGETGAGVTKNTAGIEVDRGTELNVSILWNETDQTWTYTNNGTNFFPFGSGGGGGGGSSSANIASISQTNPVTITTSQPHGFSDFAAVTIADTGVSQLDGNSYYVNVLTGSSFELYSDDTLTTPVDGTAFDLYVSGGTATMGSGISYVSQDKHPSLGGNLNITNKTIYSSVNNVVLYTGTPGSGATGLFVNNDLNSGKELATASKSIIYGIIFS